MQRNKFHEVTFENDNVIMREQFLCHISCCCYPKPSSTGKCYPCSSSIVFNSSVLYFFAFFFNLPSGRVCDWEQNLHFLFCFVLNPLLFWKISKADLFHTVPVMASCSDISQCLMFLLREQEGSYHEWMTTRCFLVSVPFLTGVFRPGAVSWSGLISPCIVRTQFGHWYLYRVKVVHRYLLGV